MAVEQPVKVDIGHPITIGGHEGPAVLDVGGDAFEAPASVGLFTGFGKSHSPAVFVVFAVNFAPARSQSDSEVAIVGFIIQEVVTNQVALVAEANHEIRMAIA